MMDLFRYCLENDLKKLNGIHEPYRSMLRAEYSEKVAKGELTEAEYLKITGEQYVAPVEEIVEAPTEM